MAKIRVDVSAKFNFDSAKVRQMVKAELFKFGEEVMALSKERVPVDTGTLMNSGFVEPPQETNREISVRLGYGGAAAEYAISVHENMNPNVHWKRPGSGPKYLERPFLDKSPELPDRVREAFIAAIVP